MFWFAFHVVVHFAEDCRDDSLSTAAYVTESLCAAMLNSSCLMKLLDQCIDQAVSICSSRDWLLKLEMTDPLGLFCSLSGCFS